MIYARFLCLVMCILMIISLFGIRDTAKAQLSPGSDLRTIHLRMCAEGLSPVQPSEDEVTRRKSVPNGFEHGLVARFGQTVYKPVGEWSRESISGTITIVQPVVFNLWVSSSGSSSADFKFTLKYGSAVIAGPAADSITGLSREAKLLQVTTTANLTTTQAGKALILSIEGKVNGDGVMVEFGDIQKDSGVSFFCNAIDINEKTFHACTSKISVEFMDSFRAPISSVHSILKIDGVVVEDPDEDILERSISETGLNQFTWRMPLCPGKHNFEIGVAYSEADINQSWAIIVNGYNVPAKSEKSGMDFFREMEPGDMVTSILFILFLLIYLIIMFSILRKRAIHNDPFVRASPVPFHYGIIVRKRKKSFSKRERRPPAGKPFPGGFHVAPGMISAVKPSSGGSVFKKRTSEGGSPPVKRKMSKKTSFRKKS